MANYSILIICLLGFWFSSNVSDAAAKRPKRNECGQGELDHLDNLISSILPFNDPKVGLPERIEDFPEFCRYYGDVLSEIEALNKRCMKEAQRSFVSLMIYNIRRGSKNVCGKKAIQSKKLTPTKRHFMEISKCVNRGSDQLKKCSQVTTAHLVAIENAPKKQRMPMLCCEMLKIQDCIESVFKSQPGCHGPDFEKRIHSLLKGSGVNPSQGPMAQVCGEHIADDKCSKIKLPRRKRGQKVPKSFITPVIHLMEDL